MKFNWIFVPILAGILSYTKPTPSGFSSASDYKFFVIARDRRGQNHLGILGTFVSVKPVEEFVDSVKPFIKLPTCRVRCQRGICLGTCVCLPSWHGNRCQTPITPIYTLHDAWNTLSSLFSLETRATFSRMFKQTVKQMDASLRDVSVLNASQAIKQLQYMAKSIGILESIMILWVFFYWIRDKTYGLTASYSTLASGQWFRLFTFPLLQYSLMNLSFDLYSFYFDSRQVYSSLGQESFLKLYLLTSIVSLLCTWIWNASKDGWKDRELAGPAVLLTTMRMIVLFQACDFNCLASNAFQLREFALNLLMFVGFQSVLNGRGLAILIQSLISFAISQLLL